MSKEQKTPTEAFLSFEETVKNTLLAIYESINGKLKRIDWLVEKSLYFQMFFNPLSPEEEKENKTKLAKYRMSIIMKRLTEELGQEKSNEVKLTQ